MPRRARLAAAAALAVLAPALAEAAPDWAPRGWSPRGGAPAEAGGPVVVAARPIPSGAIVTAGDVALASSERGGGLARLEDAVGLEARVTLYAGRPIRPEDVGPPARVERNDLVLLRYRAGALLITAEGRALDRGAVGERIRAMNLASRRTVTGRVAEDGAVEIAQ